MEYTFMLVEACRRQPNVDLMIAAQCFKRQLQPHLPLRIAQGRRCVRTSGASGLNVLVSSTAWRLQGAFISRRLNIALTLALL